MTLSYDEMVDLSALGIALSPAEMLAGLAANLGVRPSTMARHLGQMADRVTDPERLELAQRYTMLRGAWLLS